MEGLDALKISEAKKKYIVDLLNPVLEEMVAECIHRMPTDPVPFMLEWLEQKKVCDEDKMLTGEEKEALAAENDDLKQKVTKVKSQMQEAAKLAASEGGGGAGDDEEEEEDDDDDEPPPDFFKEQTGPPKARQSVSAEAYGEWNAKKTFVPPVIAKSDDQKDRLKNCLSKSFLFTSLDDKDLNLVIGAMKEVVAEPKQRVINQGESGDFLFVIESGTVDCIIKLPDGTEKTVKTCGVGDVFGELALLYNCPRAATVEAAEKSILWQLDRDTFNAIVKEAAQKKRTRYDTFLAKVPLLASMDAYERGQLTDALKPELLPAGGVIVSQGEEGNKFYIIEEGEAGATKNGVEVMSYSSGDYFGELALIRNQPRAATVTCKTNCRLLSIDNVCFKRLLDVNALLDKSTKYK
jgi:cAMP-dependent protein kinase regulator